MIKTSARGALSLMTALALTGGLLGCSALTRGPVETPATEATAEPVVRKEATPAPERTAAPEDQGAALDRYVAEAQAQIPAMMGDTDLIDGLQIRAVHPDTIEYEYHYAEEVDLDGVAAYLDGMVPTFRALCDSLVIPEMEREGITVDPKVRYTYYSADGSMIWSYTFERSS